MAIMQTQTATRKPQFMYTYQASNLAGTATGTLTGQQTDVLDRTMIGDGSVYGISVQLSGTITSGTLIVTPAINGTLQTSHISLTRNAAGTQFYHGKIEGRQARFLEGDELRVFYQTVSLTPTTLDIICDVYVILEDIDV